MDNEFLASAGKTTDEPRSKTLEQFAKDVLADPEYQRSVEARAKSGKLTPSESRMLMEAGRRQQQQDEVNRPKSRVQTMMEAATPFELDVWLNVARRALGQEEHPIRVANKHVTIAEIMAVLEEVYRP